MRLHSNLVYLAVLTSTSSITYYATAIVNAPVDIVEYTLTYNSRTLALLKYPRYSREFIEDALRNHWTINWTFIWKYYRYKLNLLASRLCPDLSIGTPTDQFLSHVANQSRIAHKRMTVKKLH